VDDQYKVLFVVLITAIVILSFLYMRARLIIRARTEEVLIIRLLWLREKASRGDLLAQRKIAHSENVVTDADVRWAEKLLNENPRV